MKYHAIIIINNEHEYHTIINNEHEYHTIINNEHEYHTIINSEYEYHTIINNEHEYCPSLQPRFFLLLILKSLKYQGVERLNLQDVSCRPRLVCGMTLSTLCLTSNVRWV